MEGELTMHPARRRRLPLPRALVAHPFVSLLIAGVLVGGGLRFVPSTAASGSSGSGQTACAAK
jgi:hypothetical protein